MGTEEVEAVVQKIVEGQHGDYAITTSEKIEGSITFSLEKKDEVWQEKNYPEPGVYVVLSELCKKRNGWRARVARFLKPNNNKVKAL